MKLRFVIILALIIAGVAIPAKLALDAVNSQTANAQEQSAETSDGSGNDADASTDGRVFIDNLRPNENTPDNYIAPSYDPFNNLYRPQQPYAEQYPPKIQPNTVPVADFTIESPDRKGFTDKDAVTAGTRLKFNALKSFDEETADTRLQVRWDFEGDGKPDSYFSADKTISHVYQETGIYYVTLEVLDKAGAVSKTAKKLTVVNNTPPTAHQIAATRTGTPATVFEFDTGKSSDSQYVKSALAYRFDWDNDGIWDTVYKSKTLWRHKFAEPGKYRVVMEVKDPEGLSGTYYQDVEVIPNTPPQARFTVSLKNGTYSFDAGTSTDAESPKKLSYRWDFNYTGPDDIVFDTRFSPSPRYSGTYTFSGQKTVRLQVKDADGALDEAFYDFDVP